MANLNTDNFDDPFGEPEDNSTIDELMLKICEPSIVRFDISELRTLMRQVENKIKELNKPVELNELSRIVNNIEQIQDEEKKIILLKILFYIIKQTSNFNSNEVEIILNNLFSKNIIEELEIDNLTRITEFIVFAYWRVEHPTLSGKIMEEILQKFKLDKTKAIIFATEAIEIEKFTEGFGTRIIETILNDANIDKYEEMIKVWLLTKDEFHIRSNLLSIIELESWKKGSVNLLNKKFGIINFSRYPISVLKNQLEIELSNDAQVILFVYPTEDFNGAYMDTNKSLEALYNNAGFGQGEMVIFEAKNKVDLYRILSSTIKKNVDAKNIIIAGHGTQTSMELSSSRGGSIDIADVIDFFNRQNRSTLFTKVNLKDQKANLILLACNTAAGDINFAKSISEQTNLRIIAPNKSTTVFTGYFYLDETGYLNYRYPDADAVQFIDGESN